MLERVGLPLERSDLAQYLLEVRGMLQGAHSRDEARLVRSEFARRMKL